MIDSIFWVAMCVIWAGIGGYMIGWLIAVMMDDSR
jgi:hypothetical protein